MGGHEREADKRIFGRYSRRYHRIDKDALLEEVARYHEGLVVVAYEKRNDGRSGIAYLATYATETVESIVGNVPQMLYALGSLSIMSRAADTAAVDAGVMLALNM